MRRKRQAAVPAAATEEMILPRPLCGGEGSRLVTSCPVNENITKDRNLALSIEPIRLRVVRGDRSHSLHYAPGFSIDRRGRS
jgi:hypothetical protein